MSSTANADLRAFATAVSAALVGGGWTRNGDVGEADLTTIVANSGTNFVIYKMGDALQATYPVYLKLEFNPAASSVGALYLYMTIGTGSNGSGTITGVIKARYLINHSSSVTTANVKAILSADPDRFNFLWSYTIASGQSLYFGIERTRDSSNVATNVGVLVVQGSSSAANFAVCPFIGTLPNVETYGNAIIPAAGTALDGADVSLFELRMFYFGKIVNQTTMFFVYRGADVAGESVLSVNDRGQTNDYLFTTQTSGTSNFFTLGSIMNGALIAVRY